MLKQLILKLGTFVPLCTLIFSILMLVVFKSYALEIPAIHPNLVEKNGSIVFINEGKEYPLKTTGTKYTLAQLVGKPKGTADGINFKFGNLNGVLYFGFIKPGDGLYPQPVFREFHAKIQKGRASVNILTYLGGKFDMVNWQESGQGTLGYRVVKEDGTILYDGKLAFRGKGPFKVNSASIIEGPFLNYSAEGHFHDNIRISFTTLSNTIANVILNTPTRIFPSTTSNTQHEISLTGLTPETAYSYTVETSDSEYTYSESYSFQTAPVPGSRKPFTFAYASDSRLASGGGERNLEGTNAYIMKKIAALVRYKKATFLQFTGDMIDGELSSVAQTKVEYRNWKRSIEPFAHYMPILTTIGNHEAIVHHFKIEKNIVSIDSFPYPTNSTEAVFAGEFVHPTNGPESEDGAEYDPNPSQQDFPTYKENVFYYIYDNIAMVVLNTNYWYTIKLNNQPEIGGNLHGYLMEQQLKWLEATLASLDADANLDFIFITLHTPPFPNGGHVADDMWYAGKNEPRAVVKHSANGPNLIKYGIIEQRDKFLQIAMQSRKVIGFLTGDEHNFNWLQIHQGVNIYPKNWDKKDIRQWQGFRPLYQVNNGAAGAPYYAQQQTPWTEHVHSFTTQNAVVFFHIHADSIQMEVLNPDTLDTIWPLNN